MPDEHRSGRRSAAPALVPAVLLSGCSGIQSTLEPAGPHAELIATLWWVMFVVGALIFALVMVLLLAASLRSLRSARARPLSARHSRRLVIAGGIVLPLVVVVPFAVSSFSISRAVTPALPDDALTIEVVGRLWWWEVHYLDAEGERTLTTANEIHIPVGQPVRVLLKSDNVIHSFWVPRLQGKVDMIPGEVNTLQLHADRPGVYRGQCAEYCGTQHALMAFEVVAEPPQQFRAWFARQRMPAAAPATTDARRGLEVFLNASCVDCHAIRGTEAEATKGPDLTHLASRLTLAAGTVPNRRGHLAGWIADPQRIKPGALMPPTELPAADLRALLAYLESLK